jgi:hypothetical protein
VCVRERETVTERERERDNFEEATICVLHIGL